MSGPSFQLILLAALLVPAILFFLTQQNMLKLIHSENRELEPGLVWLQFIPLFNLYWVFVVVTRIADSISKQNASFQDDSILGISNYDSVEAIGKRPTYKIGIAWCILFTLGTIMYGFPDMSVAVARGGLSLATMVCWIIYWVQLAGEKRKLKALQA